MTSKKDVIEYLRQSVDYHLDESINKDKFSEVVGFLLSDLLSYVESNRMPVFREFGWFYEVDLNKDSIDLLMHFCTDYKLEDNGLIEESISSENILIKSVKCKYLSVNEYAVLHNVTSQAVRQWLRRGKLRFATKTANGWLIPELCNKPLRGYVPVTYTFINESEYLHLKYPFTKHLKQLAISQSECNKDLYEIELRYNSYSREIILTTKQRETLELAVLSSNSVTCEEWGEKLYYPESKYKKKYYKGQIMMEQKYEEEELLYKEFRENNYHFKTLITQNNYEEMYINEFSISLYKGRSKIASINDSILLTNELNDPESYDYVWCADAVDFCDSIDGDYYEMAVTLYNEDHTTIKKEILYSLNIDEYSAYDVSILLVRDIEIKTVKSLDLFLKYFRFSKDLLPNLGECIIAIFLNKKNEKDKLAPFITYDWKFINCDNSTAIAYTKL